MLAYAIAISSKTNQQITIAIALYSSFSNKVDRPFILFLNQRSIALSCFFSTKGRSQLKIVSFQECRIQSQKLHLEYTAAKLSGDRPRLDG